MHSGDYPARRRSAQRPVPASSTTTVNSPHGVSAGAPAGALTHLPPRQTPEAHCSGLVHAPPVGTSVRVGVAIVVTVLVTVEVAVCVAVPVIVGVPAGGHPGGVPAGAVAGQKPTSLSVISAPVAG